MIITDIIIFLNAVAIQIGLFLFLAVYFILVPWLYVKKFFYDMFGWFSDIGTNAKETLEDAYDSVKEGISNIGDEVKKQADNIGEGASKAFDDTGEFFKKRLNDVGIDA